MFPQGCYASVDEDFAVSVDAGLRKVDENQQPALDRGGSVSVAPAYAGLAASCRNLLDYVRNCGLFAKSLPRARNTKRRLAEIQARHRRPLCPVTRRGRDRAKVPFARTSCRHPC